MIIRKTAKEQKRFTDTWMGIAPELFSKEDSSDDQHIEVVLVETWWFLFVPLYCRETVLRSNM